MQPFWTAQLQAFSGYDACAVRACIVELHALHRKAAYSNLRAVFDKYADAALGAVSPLVDSAGVRSDCATWPACTLTAPPEL